MYQDREKGVLCYPNSNGSLSIFVSSYIRFDQKKSGKLNCILCYPNSKETLEYTHSVSFYLSFMVKFSVSI
jgi:hypothetical protein